MASSSWEVSLQSASPDRAKPRARGSLGLQHAEIPSSRDAEYVIKGFVSFWFQDKQQRDAQKYKVLRRMSPGKISSPRAYGYSDDARQIDRQHHNYFAGRAQTQRGQVLITQCPQASPVDITRGLTSSRIQLGSHAPKELDRQGEVMVTAPQTSCRVSTRCWRRRPAMLSVCSLEKLTPVSLTFLLIRLYSETKTQCRFVFQ